MNEKEKRGESLRHLPRMSVAMPYCPSLFSLLSLYYPLRFLLRLIVAVMVLFYTLLLLAPSLPLTSPSRCLHLPLDTGSISISACTNCEPWLKFAVLEWFFQFNVEEVPFMYGHACMTRKKIADQQKEQKEEKKTSVSEWKEGAFVFSSCHAQWPSWR
jgi:hypothetical protein